MPSDLKEELRGFEEFLKRVGFKRIHGSIYGLLVLSERPLSSAEIEKELGLSQSAVSQAIKTLSMYGAINSKLMANKNYLVHEATLNTLDIVASVFRKRESETLSNYMQMAKRIKLKLEKQGVDKTSNQMKRVQSMMNTAQLGQTVIDFILTLSDLQINDKLNKVTERLPQLFNLMAKGNNFENKTEIFGSLNQAVTDKLKKHFNYLNNSNFSNESNENESSHFDKQQ